MNENIFYKTEGFELLDVKGPDARDFLNRLTTASFKNLAPGQCTAGTLLQPNGRVLVSFDAACLAPDHFQLLIGPIDPLTSASEKAFQEFDKVLFRENLKLTALKKDFIAYRVFFEKTPAIFPAINSGEVKSINASQLWSIDRIKPFKNDCLLIVPAAETQNWEESLQKHHFKQAPNPEFLRIFHQEPKPGFEITHEVMPLEVKLEYAVAENKGCYPGQEVIERIRSMGQPPRLLIRIKGLKQPPERGEKLTNAKGMDVGVITSSAKTPQGSHYDWIALSLIKRVQFSEQEQYFVHGESVAID